MVHRLQPRHLVGMILIFAMSLGLTGCGLIAFPVRATSAAMKAVPIAGHVAAVPLDATADVIDP